ncbi:hypothetical protein D3C78_800570 [compost metagenome]
MNQAVNFETLIKRCDIDKAFQKMDKQYFIAANPQVGRVVISLIAVWGAEERQTELKKIYIKHETEMDQVVKRITRLLAKHPKAKVLINRNGTGNILAELLHIKAIPFKAIQWGSRCFSNKDRKDYVDRRAQAYVCLSRAIHQGRFKFKTEDHKELIIEQLISIPYEFDGSGRFRIFSKSKIKELGLPLPDISETLAYVFLEGVNV